MQRIIYIDPEGNIQTMSVREVVQVTGPNPAPDPAGGLNNPVERNRIINDLHTVYSTLADDLAPRVDLHCRHQDWKYLVVTYDRIITLIKRIRKLK